MNRLLCTVDIGQVVEPINQKGSAFFVEVAGNQFLLRPAMYSVTRKKWVDAREYHANIEPKYFHPDTLVKVM